MSKEGIFQLFHNTASYSNLNNLLTARKLLEKRIINVTKENKTPSWRDIVSSHEFVLDRTYKPMVALGHDWTVSPPVGGANFGGSVRFDMPKYGDFVYSQFVHVRITSFGDPNGSTYYRYCNKPGIKLFEEVSYKTANPLDTYNRNDILFYDKYEVSGDRRKAWNRCIGQDNGTNAVYWHPLQQVDQISKVMTGPQTRKSFQPVLDMYIPLHFWYNESPSKALPRIATAALQHFIEIKLARVLDMIEATDVNGVVVPIPENVINSIKFEKFQLYTNFIYVEPIVKEIYFNKIGFQLITLHQSMFKPNIFKANDSIPLQSAVKYPISTMFWAFQPTENTGVNTWDKFCKLIPNDICIPAIVNAVQPPPLGVSYPNPTKQLVVRDMMFFDDIQVIRDFGIESAGNSLVDLSPAGIFSKYHPYIGDVNETGILAAEDDCAYTYSWEVIPLNKNVTGFLNTSVGRELYLTYVSNTDNFGNNLISTANPVNFIFSTKAYNFLTISDNQIFLRFAE